MWYNSVNKLKGAKMDFIKQVKGVIIGHAVGDALGVPVEFASRGELAKNPVTEMEGYGTYPVPKGAWSDDTSMTICSFDGLKGDKINFDLIMQNFAKWYYNDEFTPTGKTFDVGTTCAIAIGKYVKGSNWKECGLNDEKNNGNGSLMRINPFVLFTYLLNTNTKTKIDIIELASSLTHAHERSKIACGIYAFVLWELLKEPSITSVFKGLEKAKSYYANNTELKYYNRIFSQTFAFLPSEEIKSSGYVVDSLEASLWCLLTTNSYKECVLKAVNLGEDTDTIGAIAGGLAGALYGYHNIPIEWREALIKKDYLEDLCQKTFS